MIDELQQQPNNKLWQLYNKAASLMNNNDLEGAKTVCREIFKLDKNDANGHKIYGMILKHQGHFQDAVESFSQILDNPSEQASYLDITMYLFECLEALDRHDEVVFRVDKLLEQFPFDVRLLYLKAKILAKQGDVQKALEHYKQVVMFPSPNDLVHQEIKAYSHLYIMTAPSLKPVQWDIEAVNLQLSQTQDEYVQSTLCFALAHGFERVENYPEAMRAFSRGNGLMWQTNRLDFKQMLANFEQIKTVNWQNKKLMQEIGASEVTPFFIEGVPRSGSTLVESILAEIPGVESCGEAPYLSQAITQAALKQNLSEEALILNLDSEIVSAVKREYLMALQKEHKSTLLFTDKMLNNYEYIGLKALAFPNARFIHIYKNPLDAAFSMYRQTFKLGEHTYSYHLKTCAFMVKYSRMCIDYWKSVFPQRIYELNYEICMKDGENSWRAFFEWLDIDWQTDYLNFFSSKRDVETMSSAQVRQKMTSQYSNRSDKYGDLLVDLKDYLQQPIELLAELDS